MGVVSLVALGVAGCGSSGDAPATSATTRAGADATSCGEKRSSGTYYFTFMNDLDADVTLEVPRDSWSCDGYSGVSTPGALNGRTIGFPGAQPRIRMETAPGEPTQSAFTLVIKARGDTLARVGLSPFRWPGDLSPWGIEINGDYRCSRPVVPLANGAGYLTMTKSCKANALGDVVFHLTQIKPN